MANKRDLKKQIRLICGDLAAECSFAIEMINGIDKEKMVENIRKIATLQTETLAHVSFDFDKTPSDFENKAAYHKALYAYNDAAFKKLRDDFNAGVEAIVKDMNAALPKQKKAE